jgi:hypothetical protein
MALTWAAKAPGDVYRYTWSPPLAYGDGLGSYTASVSGAVIDNESMEDNSVVLYVSGGTAGTTATFTLEATSDQGETLTEKVYLPIVAVDATGMTARDVCEFALRKVYGKDETPEASAMSDAIERLNDMLLAWKWTGADVGAAFPLVEASVIYCKPEFQGAIKANLILEIADLYDLPISIKTAQNALRGMQLIKTANLPEDRAAGVYY